MAQHHHISSTDVFSYTAQGEPWVYPVGCGTSALCGYLLGGYGLISWIGALACVGTVALLLRRGSAVSAGIAILAVPLIAWRTAPRADMFTVVLFAAFLSLLWENYQTGRARLWLLPLLMLAWVNLHFGFAAGLALMAAYVGVELSEAIYGEARRRAAMQRLRRASGWLVCHCARHAGESLGLGHLSGAPSAAASCRTAATQHRRVESSADDLERLQHGIFGAGDPGRDLLCCWASRSSRRCVAMWKGQLGAALMLLAATYPPVHHVRMGAVFACVVVVVGGPVLTAALVDLGSDIKQARTRSTVAWAAVLLFAALALLRSFDLVTNRHYFRAVDESTFGAGLGWWFPERAAEFIERENLPAEIFNTYDEGSYLTWKLGPKRRDYIDGRDTLFGVAHGCSARVSCSSSRRIRRPGSRRRIATTSIPSSFRWGVLMASSWCSSKASATAAIGDLSTWTRSPRCLCAASPRPKV